MSKDKYKKIKIKGWLEIGEEPVKFPDKCPKCGTKLKYTDALQECNWYLVWCPNYRCRWSEIYVE